MVIYFKLKYFWGELNRKAFFVEYEATFNVQSEAPLYVESEATVPVFFLNWSIFLESKTEKYFLLNWRLLFVESWITEAVLF